MRHERRQETEDTGKKPDVFLMEPAEYLELMGDGFLNGHRAFDLLELTAFEEYSHLRVPDYVLVHYAPKIHIPPVPHNGSESLYLIDEWYEGNDRILLSILPPYSKSSTHHHPQPVREFYWCLWGEFRVNGVLLGRGDRHLILPGEVHQAATEKELAIILIRMENAKEVPESQLHVRSIT